MTGKCRIVASIRKHHVRMHIYAGRADKRQLKKKAHRSLEEVEGSISATDDDGSRVDTKGPLHTDSSPCSVSALPKPILAALNLAAPRARQLLASLSTGVVPAFAGGSPGPTPPRATPPRATPIL